MDKLLTPDTGLMVWTAVTFLLLVLVLTKAAWKPILDGINKREAKLRDDLDRAEKSQQEAEALRRRFEEQLAETQKTVQLMMNQAKEDGERARAQLVAAAKEESERLLERGRRELSGETERLKESLRSEVADVSLAMAEKLLQRSVDPKIHEELIRSAAGRTGEINR